MVGLRGAFPVSNLFSFNEASGYFFRKSIAPSSHGAGPLCGITSGNSIDAVSNTRYPFSSKFAFQAIGSKSEMAL